MRHGLARPRLRGCSPRNGAGTGRFGLHSRWRPWFRPLRFGLRRGDQADCRPGRQPGSEISGPPAPLGIADGLVQAADSDVKKPPSNPRGPSIVHSHDVNGPALGRRGCRTLKRETASLGRRGRPVPPGTGATVTGLSTCPGVRERAEEPPGRNEDRVDPILRCGRPAASLPRSQPLPLRSQRLGVPVRSGAGRIRLPVGRRRLRRGRFLFEVGIHSRRVDSGAGLHLSPAARRCRNSLHGGDRAAPRRRSPQSAHNPVGRRAGPPEHPIARSYVGDRLLLDVHPRGPVPLRGKHGLPCGFSATTSRAAWVTGATWSSTWLPE